MKATTTPAAGYLRRSTDKQEQSLADQRREIEKYAAEHRYRIVRWYQDDAISGDDTKKRRGFLEMHKCATNSRDFDAIIVWDLDRFGRFDLIEAGSWIQPIREAGVRLVTVTEGAIDWSDFAGRLTYSVKQEGKHQFLRDLSRNVCRGQISNAKNGYSCGQAAPYGYDRMLVDEQKQHRQRVHNGESFVKPRSWKVTFVLSDDPTKVEIARWLFHEYAEKDIGIRHLVESLNARGIKPPCKKLWHVGTVRELLRNQAYVGDFVWAKRRFGKYHRVAAGEIRQRDRRTFEHNSPEEYIVAKDAHEPLVDRKLWERVQKKLTLRRGRRSSHKQKNGDGYLLSGMIFCGHCGKKMHGALLTRRKGNKTYRYHKYVCQTYVMNGHKSGCGRHAVEQELIVSFLLRKLREGMLGGSRDALRERIVARLRKRHEPDTAKQDSLRKAIADLDRQIDQATDRLLKAPENLLDLLAPKIQAMRDERDRLGGELELLDAPREVADPESEADAIMAKAWTLAEDLTGADPARVRELLRRLVSRVDLWFDRRPCGKLVKCPLSRGTIELRSDPPTIGLVCFGTTRRRTTG